MNTSRINELKAKVKAIQEKGFLHVVEFQTVGEEVYMMGLELPDISIDDEVILSVKPTHISLALEYPKQTSISNILKAVVKEVKNGKVLSSITLEFEDSFFESIITSQASKRLGLKQGDKVYMLIKSSELFIKSTIHSSPFTLHHSQVQP
jgi:molybdopterin-binding protein